MFDDTSRPPLRESVLRAALVDGPLADYTDLEVVGQIGSTNAEMLERAKRGAADRSVLIAEHQTAGRGRLGRAWEAPARSQIALSVLLRPGAVHPDLLGWLPLVTGLAVRDALAGSAEVDAVLKWPNDVQVADPFAASGAKKLAGILVEMTTVPMGGQFSLSLPALVVGVGLNVSLQPYEFPRPDVTSIDIERAIAQREPCDRGIVVRELLRALAVRHAQWRACERGSASAISHELFHEYQQACDTVGRHVRVILPGGAERRGTAVKVDRSGRLVVAEDGSGEEFAVAAGDVQHLRPTTEA